MTSPVCIYFVHIARAKKKTRNKEVAGGANFSSEISIFQQNHASVSQFSLQQEYFLNNYLISQVP